MIMKVPHTEKVVLAGDLNGHVGESQIGFERWHGGFSEKSLERKYYIWPKLLT